MSFLKMLKNIEEFQNSVNVTYIKREIEKNNIKK